MNERIRELRKVLNLTLEQFGQTIGIQKSAVSKIELGRTTITEQSINLILKTEWNGKYVSEDWLRTGKGDMFTSPPIDEMALIMTKIDKLPALRELLCSLEGDTFNKFLVELNKMLSDLKGEN